MATNNAVNEATAASGKILQGQGVGTASAFSTATYPATATGTGKILRADGTNWSPSTATYPDIAGTIGNVLTSDGINWMGTAFTPSASGTVITVQATLTSAQIKSIHGTPITIISSPGSGKLIKVVSLTAKFVYGGTNVFVASNSQTVGLFYGSGGTAVINGASMITNTILTGTTTLYNFAGPSNYTNTAPSSIENLAVVAQNSIATEISGNAAGDNTIVVTLQYCIVSA